MTERELGFLYGTALAMPPGARCLEVGSWKGRSTVAIAEGLRSVEGASLYAVDTFEGEASNEGMLTKHADELAADEVYRSFVEHTSGYEFLTVLRTTSEGASRELADASLDWVFIDADHAFAEVLEDVRRWLPKVKPGGLLSGHDYGQAGVRFAVRASLHVDGVWENIWYSRVGGGTQRTRVVPLALGRAHAALSARPALKSGIRRLAGRR
jgi:predicted O-methyltransferase YrrM